MASLPSVAICIPTYNQALFLEKSACSALTQTYPNVEVWISDDCSTDNTEAVAVALKRHFPDLVYQRQEKNLGISANNNRLLSQPQTDFIVRLDSDDFLNPRYVEDLVQILNEHPKAGYAHCNVQEVDEHDRPRRTRRLGMRPVIQPAEQALRTSASGYRVAANICMFRAEALRALNYYRAEVEYVQDWDLSVRIADQGWGNVHSSNVLASYRVWEDAGQIRPRRKKAELEGYIQVYEESLTPAFQRRGWSLTPLNKQRRAIAIGQTSVLDAPLFSAEEREEILTLLEILGPSARLRFQAKLVCHGFGPGLRWMNKQKLLLRDTAKKAVAAGKRSRVDI